MLGIYALLIYLGKQAPGIRKFTKIEKDDVLRN
jgi:hypothetical protein